jgi:hypothetical protein
LKIKLTVHLEEHPGPGKVPGVEGIIVEFVMPDAKLTTRQAADLFRELADQYRKRLQTPAPTLTGTARTLGLTGGAPKA